jgi:hypothetical protein
MLQLRDRPAQYFVEPPRRAEIEAREFAPEAGNIQCGYDAALGDPGIRAGQLARQ